MLRWEPLSTYFPDDPPSEHLHIILKPRPPRHTRNSIRIVSTAVLSSFQALHSSVHLHLHCPNPPPMREFSLFATLTKKQLLLQSRELQVNSKRYRPTRNVDFTGIGLRLPPPLSPSPFLTVFSGNSWMTVITSNLQRRITNLSEN